MCLPFLRGAIPTLCGALAQPTTLGNVPPVVAQAVSTIVLALLGASGVAKLFDPDPTAGAMRAAHLPAGRSIVRLLALLEIASALAGLAFGGYWVSGALVLYLGFTLFTAAAVRGRIPVQSCGCFGREDTPPSVAHVLYNALAVVALAVVLVTDQGTVPWAGPLGEVVLYLGFGLIGGFLSYLLLSELPRTLSSAGPG